MTTVLGIDPGLNGGLAFISYGYPDFEVTSDSLSIGKEPMLPVAVPRIDLYPMPTIAGKDFDIQEIKKLLQKHKPVLSTIEQQISMPGQGLTSTLQTGKGFGVLLGLLAGMDMPHQVIPAKTWQHRMFTGVSAKLDTKAKSEIIAKRIFPTADFRKSDRARVAADGLTDAACIAEYTRRMYLGVGPEKSTTMKPHTALEVNPNVCIRCGAYIPTDEGGCNV